MKALINCGKDLTAARAIALRLEEMSSQRQIDFAGLALRLENLVAAEQEKVLESQSTFLAREF